MKTPKFPKFDSYACIGDSIQWDKDGFTITATLEQDTDTRPTDYECYSPLKIKQWGNDEWFYVGVVLSVFRDGLEILDHAASLWGIECNYNATKNRYLSTVAQDLESEALQAAKHQVKTMLSKLELVS